MSKNPDYWNAQSLQDEGLFQIEHYMVVFIEESDPAITSLKYGEVDVLDSQYHLESKLGSVVSPWGDYVSYDGFGVQELGVNMNHRILGNGVDTPLGQYDLSRASEAARYIRQAISHLIPRQEIIDTILDGYGTPGVTTALSKITYGYDLTITPYSFDIDEAQRLLALAGYGYFYHTLNVDYEQDTYPVMVSSNSVISDFDFNQTSKRIRLNVEGISGTKGFCNIIIPSELLSGDFSIYNDEELLIKDVDYYETYSDSNCLISIMYDHSNHVIDIVGTSVIPEFPSWIMFAILITSTITVMIYKKSKSSSDPNPL